MPFRPSSGPFLQEFVQTEAASGLLDQATEERQLNTEIVRSEVTQSLAAARQQVRTDPGTAIIDLKTLREAVRQAPDLDADVRAQLLDRIDNALRQANQRKIEKDERDRLMRANRAQALERQRLLELARRDDELIVTYIEQFNSRIDERRFDLAVDVAARCLRSGPHAGRDQRRPGTRAASPQSYDQMMELRSKRQQAVLDTLYQVEKSHVPFPDEPPLVYPDPQIWQDLTNRRQKYAQVDFAKTGSAEQKILDELDRETKMDFLDDPLSDAVTYLENLHGIQIEIDQKALDDIALTTDTPVTKQLSGITLRSALKLMLRDLGLTYVIAGRSPADHHARRGRTATRHQGLPGRRPGHPHPDRWAEAWE